jgi:peptidoglycan/xylan/chitin deacetylase (PgdA/CDA1 family)
MNLTDTYLKETLALFLGLSKDQQHHLPAWPESLAQLLTREEEYAPAPRDQWDNWEHPYSDNYLRNALWIPEIDLWIQELKKDLQKSIPLAPLWPQGYRFAVCLTHDVDYVSNQMTFRQRCREVLRTYHASDLKSKSSELVKKILKLILKSSHRSPNSADVLEASCQIEQELGVTSSYFFTVYPITDYSQYDCLYNEEDSCQFFGRRYRVKDVMQWLVQNGFDVGLHGSYYSATKDSLLEQQKEALEKTVKAPVTTTRQHWLHWSHPKTALMQSKAGFLADTSLGYNRNIGFRAGTSLPFYHFDLKNRQQLQLLEVPLIIQDGALLGNNALELTPKLALSMSKKMIDLIANNEGCATFLFHPDLFVKQEVRHLYREIILYCQNQGAWVTNLSAIQQWWEHRRHFLVNETEKNRHY